ncbi:hypothetical protein DENSPDRAFT_885033 [Dentipellis sp. KUC8613]|nr:hypothetical protein DENSPDRAFT_885033 [Dentipellis sp. KUC8613]
MEYGSQDKEEMPGIPGSRLCRRLLHFHRPRMPPSPSSVPTPGRFVPPAHHAHFPVPPPSPTPLPPSHAAAGLALTPSPATPLTPPHAPPTLPHAAAAPSHALAMPPLSATPHPTDAISNTALRPSDASPHPSDALWCHAAPSSRHACRTALHAHPARLRPAPHAPAATQDGSRRLTLAAPPALSPPHTPARCPPRLCMASHASAWLASAWLLPASRVLAMARNARAWFRICSLAAPYTFA